MANLLKSYLLEEDSSCSRNRVCLSHCLPLKCLPRDSPHLRRPRQLLRGSALLPRPSTLKLVSLPLASGASLRLALGDASYALLNYVAPEGIKGGRNRERKCRILHIDCQNSALSMKMRSQYT